jgi:NADP-dependent 3-hydroxy acid dehydrogenase YdfG
VPHLVIPPSTLSQYQHILTSSPGIGQSAAFALAKHGITRLALTDLNLSLLLSTSAAIKAKYPDVAIETTQLDVCDEKALENSIASAVKRFGRIDVALNIAGISGAGKATHEGEEREWVKVVDVNLNGVWRSQRAELRAMMRQE